MPLKRNWPRTPITPIIPSPGPGFLSLPLGETDTALAAPEKMTAPSCGEIGLFIDLGFVLPEKFQPFEENS